MDLNEIKNINVDLDYTPNIINVDLNYISNIINGDLLGKRQHKLRKTPVKILSSENFCVFVTGKFKIQRDNFTFARYQASSSVNRARQEAPVSTCVIGCVS